MNPERIDSITTILKSLTQLGIGIIALLFTLQVLIGPDHLVFPINTLENMIQLSGDLGPPGLYLVLAVLALSWAFTRKR
tara:strand:+ start:350 stop:586 length:237 start_codon:yes stop_codon:yes gene_type:complete